MDQNKSVISLGQPRGLEDEWWCRLAGAWESSAESDLPGFPGWVKGVGRVKIELGVGGQFLVVTKHGRVARISDAYVQHLRQDLHASQDEIDKLRRMEFAAVEYFTIDPRTGALSELKAPAWGTAASQAFWKPAVEGFNQPFDEGLI